MFVIILGIPMKSTYNHHMLSRSQGLISCANLFSFVNCSWEMLIVLSKEENKLLILPKNHRKPGTLAVIPASEISETLLMLHLPRFNLSTNNPMDVKEILGVVK